MTPTISDILCNSQTGAATATGLTSNMVPPLPGENFRSYLCRHVSSQQINPKTKPYIKRVLLKHYRDAGMNVDRLAVDAIAAIRAYRDGYGE